MSFFKNHPLITGTALLTFSGLISRVIGFVYRIYLSRLVGAEGMGLYQILSPVLAIAFSLTAAGYQTSISKLIAEMSAGDRKVSHSPLFAGIIITLPLSCICTYIIYTYSDFIASFFLQEPSVAPLLKILSLSIPFSSVHSCINGYFYGVKKAGYPAAAQIIEQLTRVSCVFVLSQLSISQGKVPDVSVAVTGLMIGEIFSFLVSAVTYLYVRRQTPAATGDSLPFKGLLALALPLTGSRIVLNLLGSVENVALPGQLRLYGYDNSTALSVFGVLNGMAIPFIFFPNALTGSIAVVLLPMISEKKALQDTEGLRTVISKTLRYCFLMGAFFLVFFMFFGKFLGNSVFQEPLAGHFITTLSFICPFLYLDTPLSGILQGLGMTGGLFFINVSAMLMQLGFLFLFVPRFGITGYLWGLLAAQIWTTGLYLLCLHRELKRSGC